MSANHWHICSQSKLTELLPSIFAESRLVDAQEDLASGPLPWELLLGLLQERGDNSDVGVRLTACTALKQAMDVSQPSPPRFTYFLPSTALTLIVGWCLCSAALGDGSLVLQKLHPAHHRELDASPARGA